MTTTRPRTTIRLRLTAMYTGLFVLAGGALLAVTYLLVAQTLPEPSAVIPISEPGSTGEPRLEAGDSTRGTLLRFRADVLSSLLTQSALALGVVTIGAAVLGWFMAGRVVRPIHQITETARRVADRSLHERIDMQGPKDELTELADTFDAMLERLDRAFDGQRSFVGNAAHELRTPMAINRTLLEVELARPDASDDLRQLGDRLLAVNARHERLIDGLLLLASSDTTISKPAEVDLAQITAHLIERIPSNGVDVRPDVQPAVISGDPVLLERLIHNLLDNATRYNRPDGWVEVTIRDLQTGAELVVTNTGPTIATYEIPNLFEPFRRGEDRVRSGAKDRGAGLGLSIVRSVARAHGGNVAAEPHEGGGLIVRTWLPAHR